ncbi:hypothetical protein ACN4EG_02525 [Alkalinema pantanalense CENA528]|uniref:hypothetical protein n=1 Tax=Alkalinema pantanalense TaxID=1620705 RepID=UPI003D6DFB47
MSRAASVGGIVIAAIVGVGVKFGVPALLNETSIAMNNPFPNSSPLHEPFYRMTKKIADSPTMKEQFKSVSKDQAEQLGSNLAKQGLKRLDDTSLERRAVILSSMLAKMDTKSCASVVTGQPLTGDDQNNPIFMALEKLDPQSIDDWFQLSYKAMELEAQKVPAPAFDQSKMQPALKAVLKTMPEDDAQKFIKVMQSISSPSGAATTSSEDSCWAGRKLYDSMKSLPQEHKVVLARALAQE